jgi:hypothetical protein
VRRLLLPVLLLPLALLAPALAGEEGAAVHHEIVATLDPPAHALEVVDAFVPPAGGPAVFHLHAGFTVEALPASGYDVQKVAAPKPDAGAQESPPAREEAWRLVPRAGAKPGADAVLRWKGTIHQPPQAESQEYARSFSRTPGTIEEAGVFLGGASGWLPRFGDELVTFLLTAHLPAGWKSVSQGVRAGMREEDGQHTDVWSCKHPMDEVYLIANRFHVTERPAGAVETYAFLRSRDPALANRYLEATGQYLEMYRQLIGPYPFGKFALVENFWETGYGMPSFTLLGPRILRFPFILHSSYPHEILHNWWGNSVYVDWKTGNWCEGLTAYLADHLIREGQGRGAEYRRDTLKAYRDYVKAGKDFPLTGFRSRHSAATQAVGYGKCLMLFHMLRRDLGDGLFTRCLQRFYRDWRFRRASFDDLCASFGRTARRDLTPFFDQWVKRTGAPALSLGTVGRQDGNVLAVTLRQTQAGAPYDLHVPVAVTLQGRSAAYEATLHLHEREQTFPLNLPGVPLRVDVDPEFDVFRRLDRAEIPPTLSQVFGASKVTLVLPAPDDPQAEAWRTFAGSWSRHGDVRVVEAPALKALPADRGVWVLGADNPWRRALADALKARGAGLRGDRIDFGTVDVPRAGHSFVYVVRHPLAQDLAVGWIGSDGVAALPGLARKLPHYGKYSHLAFQGDAPDNVDKGTWPATRSPLGAVLGGAPGNTRRGTLPARQPLARLAPVFDRDRLLAQVRWLADPAREGRGVGTKGLDAAGDYVAAAFAKAGLEPGGDDGTFFQVFTAPNGPGGKTVTLRNVVGVIPGTDPALAGRSVVLGAHYDHLGRGWPDGRKEDAGQIYNGADDNASGVSVLLEVARVLAPSLAPRRTVVFVAFSGEEWGLKGSRHYVEAMKRWPASKALAMVNMDCVGRLEGKKLQVLGAGTAKEWRPMAMGVGFTTGVESECIDEDPGGSDQRSFVAAGVPAVQLFTGAHADYHRPTDDVEKIDADGMVRVATFVREMLAYLAGREKPLTSTIQPGAAAATPAPGAGRRVSLGTMPAFDFPGPGVKVAAVLPGTPAEKAGIRKGDVLLSLDGTKLGDLRAFADALRARAPGDVVKITLRRGTQEKTVEATLVAR